MTFKYLSVFFFMFLAIGCSGSENADVIIDGGDQVLANITPAEAISIAFDNPKDLPENEILRMVNCFSKTNYTHNMPCKVTMNKEFKINLSQNKSFSRSSNAEEIKFYVVNLIHNENTPELNGFAVACADERYPAILAYVEEGVYEKIEGTPAELMLLQAQTVALNYITKANELKSDLRERTLEKICKTLNINPSEFNYDKYQSKLYIQQLDLDNDEIKARGAVVQNPSGTILGQVGPLCGTTRIIQGWPCNQYIDEVDEATHGPVWQSSQHNGRYPAGCANVALATICSFLKPAIYCTDLGRNINWSNVYNTYFNPFAMNPNAYSETTPQAIEVANLLKTISKGTKTTFSAIGGSTSTANAATYMKSIGVNMGTSTVAINYNSIRPSLASYGLVYATGTGRAVSRSEGIVGSHAWTIDGYQVRSRVSRVELQNYNCYVNCNFGWIEGEISAWYTPVPCNGWYLCDSNGAITNFDVTQQYGSFYDIDLKCIVNIK